jgi:hypothetical protein
MSKINQRVWKAIGINYVINGKIVSQAIDKHGWTMVKIDWEKPHSDFKINDWQNYANLGRLIHNENLAY